jgi:capsular exopolysaccharide synthesis family protein
MRHGESFEDFEETSSFDLRKLQRVMMLHRWWIVGAVALGLVPAIVYPLTLRDTYAATATIAVRARPQVMDMGSDFMPGEVSARQRDPLGPLIAVAQSDAVLGRVIDQMPESDGRGSSRSLLSWVKQELGVSAPVEITPEQRRKARIEGLRRSLEFESGSSILGITASGGDADQVTFLANTAADAMVAYDSDRRDSASRRAMTWLNNQIFELRGQIDRKKEALTELVERTGIKPQVAETMNSERIRVETELQSAQAQLFSMRQRLADMEPSVSLAVRGARGATNAPRLRQQYSAALSQLDAARLTFTPTHPEVRRLEDVVATLRKQLGSDFDAPLPATAEEVSQFRVNQAEERRLTAQVNLLERALQEAKGADADNSAALIEYERRGRELAIDEQTLADLQDRRNKTLLGSSIDYPSTEILDYAVPPRGPAGPNRVRYMLIGVFLAFGLGGAVGFGRDMLDQAAREPEEAARVVHAPVLGMVPRINDGTPPERQSDGPPSSLAAESYRNLRTALQFALGSSRLSSLLVSSATAGEGKTTVSANLAASFAQTGRRLVLVDADMRLPRVHSVFGLTLSPGLAELIRGDVSLEEALRRPCDGRFDVITAGRVPPNPSELLASPDFAVLLARLKAAYDLVLIDSPVLLGVSDSYILGAQTDGMLLIHRPGSVAIRGLEDLRVQLSRAGARLVGIAFNQVDRNDRHFYPQYLESPYVSKGRAAGRRLPAKRRLK